MLNRLQGVFKSLKHHEVKYLVIGGIASVLHGVPRATFDLDMLIEASSDNVQRLIDALLEAGIGSAALTSVEDLLANEITILQDRVRIDVQTWTPGVDFEAAWSRKKEMLYNEQSFYVLSLDDLIATKRAAGRDVDLQDVEMLRELKNKKDSKDISG